MTTIKLINTSIVSCYWAPTIRLLTNQKIYLLNRFAVISIGSFLSAQCQAGLQMGVIIHKLGSVVTEREEAKHGSFSNMPVGSAVFASRIIQNGVDLREDLIWEKQRGGSLKT